MHVQLTIRVIGAIFVVGSATQLAVASGCDIMPALTVEPVWCPTPSAIGYCNKIVVYESNDSGEMGSRVAKTVQLRRQTMLCHDGQPTSAMITKMRRCDVQMLYALKLSFTPASMIVSSKTTAFCLAFPQFHSR